ncbi:MAG: hypothetical protein ACTSXU_14830, partial [Promethearchaeota archaeon]
RLEAVKIYENINNIEEQLYQLSKIASIHENLNDKAKAQEINAWISKIREKQGNTRNTKN